MKWWIIGAAVAAGSAAVAPQAIAQGGFAPPTCDLKKGHYLVNSAVLYLQSAYKRGVFPDDKQRYLRDAQRVLLEAIDKGRADDPAVWYYFGRYYEGMKDVDGADSAFTRAQQLAPQCTADINLHRRFLWAPILNSAVERMRANDLEGAKPLLRQANRVFTTEPLGFYYLGQVFALQSQRDSAISYLERALALATDSANAANASYADIRETGSFNVATLFQMGIDTARMGRRQQLDSAVFWYREYRKVNPNDAKATAELASVLDQAGRQAEAIALYDTVLMQADSMPTLDVFQTGVAMFRASRFQRAADAFQKGLERNPYYRDALFNLANTYLSMAQAAESTATKADLPKVQRQYGEQMTPVVERLVTADPANAASLRLLAASYQLRDMPDSTLAVLERAQGLVFDLTVSTFSSTGPTTWELKGVIANTKAQPTGVPQITFEFLSEKGEVVQTVTIPPQTIDGEGLASFELKPQGAGIAAWRYRVGG
jgi:tetratricopeptide (TPR) repeat protein